MKRTTVFSIIAALALLAVLANTADAQTVKYKKKEDAMTGVIQTVSWYSGIQTKYGSIGGDFSWLAGIRAGTVLNESFLIGGAYYRKIDDEIKADFRVGNNSPNLDFEYGGLDIEYIIQTEDLFHFTIGVLFGYGGYSFNDPDEIIEFENKFFFILEPCVNFEFNLTKWMRFYTGLSFRILFENEENPDDLTFLFGRFVNTYQYDHNDLTNIGFQFGLKFGGF